MDWRVSATTALLESALDRPRNLLAYETGSSVFDLAASQCFGIAKNYPFNDGNKRTALLSTRTFLYLNSKVLEPAQQDEVATMLAVVDGSLDEQQLAAWLRVNSHGWFRRRAARGRYPAIADYLKTEANRLIANGRRRPRLRRL